MTITMERTYLTVAEAAALWRVSAPTVYRRVAAGSIPHIRVGGPDGPIRIPAEAVEVSPSLEGGALSERRAPDNLNPAVEARQLAGRKGAA